MSDISQIRLFFFIGTEAELIKVFPIMMELEAKKIQYCIISSGQNNITESRILSLLENKNLFILDDEKNIIKSYLGYIKWWLLTGYKAIRKIKKAFSGVNLKKTILIVHGDTISTLMGAIIGRVLGAKVAHVEAGLRSRNLLNPFPEEITRILTSFISNIHFAPGKIYCDNLKRRKNVIDTGMNTIYDSLQFSKKYKLLNPIMELIKNKPFFVFVLHRQENLHNEVFFNEVTLKSIELSKLLHCVMILHKPTEAALLRIPVLFDKLKESPDITLVPRMDYFDFMKLLDKSEFVISDGGSNQEELFYMGKPCLIMRKCTERNEGLNSNARLYGGDLGEVLKFYDSYQNMKASPVTIKGMTPSQIIATGLLDFLV